MIEINHRRSVRHPNLVSAVKADTDRRSHECPYEQADENASRKAARSASPVRYRAELEKPLPDRLRPNTQFASVFKAARPVQSCREKYSNFFFSEIVLISLHPASSRGTFRPIVTTREAGMRWPRDVGACPLEVLTNDTLADVKSCGPGIPVLVSSLRRCFSTSLCDARALRK
ncbi:hypothetical protein ACQR1W_07845 [Bradyrhizobium sp. HKCCYLS1011]|uniref:hypothetical protein n=1 Tax=Bradyrhizobium sp. HKCCYLS1011 TaxID=3420733 RepID=UPI003EBFCA7E